MSPWISPHRPYFPSSRRKQCLFFGYISPLASGVCSSLTLFSVFRCVVTFSFFEIFFRALLVVAGILQQAACLHASLKRLQPQRPFPMFSFGRDGANTVHCVRWYYRRLRIPGRDNSFLCATNFCVFGLLFRCLRMSMISRVALSFRKSVVFPFRFIWSLNFDPCFKFNSKCSVNTSITYSSL